uniref:Uncharacterized protein n=1 Tax=Romanomermis culicivorax TaxID=13658 RepID=A0A915HJJ7_ROMCU
MIIIVKRSIFRYRESQLYTYLESNLNFQIVHFKIICEYLKQKY